VCIDVRKGELVFNRGANLLDDGVRRITSVSNVDDTSRFDPASSRPTVQLGGPYGVEHDTSVSECIATCSDDSACLAVKHYPHIRTCTLFGPREKGGCEDNFTFGLPKRDAATVTATTGYDNDSTTTTDSEGDDDERNPGSRPAADTTRLFTEPTSSLFSAFV
jgi:hypothetical protein